MSSSNVTRQKGQVAREERTALLGHRGVVVWLTGLSGSGKSTLAYALERALVSNGHVAFVLDGDNLRHGLSSDLGFSPADRDENIRRVGEVAALFAEAGVIAIAAFISPYAAGREHARQACGGGFVEVFLDVPLAVCERRDTKGLYRRARAGEIADFTGISAPYEKPSAPEITLDTDRLDVDTCITTILDHLAHSGVLGQARARHTASR
jgi:adenylyl-sulfate kinase